MLEKYGFTYKLPPSIDGSGFETPRTFFPNDGLLRRYIKGKSYGFGWRLWVRYDSRVDSSEYETTCQSKWSTKLV